MSKKWTTLLITVLLLVAAFPLAAGASAPSTSPAGPNHAPVGSTPTPCPSAGWSNDAAMPSTVVRAWGQYFPANGMFYSLGGRMSDTAGTELLNPREYNLTTDTWVTKTAVMPNDAVSNMVGGALTMNGASVIVLVGGSSTAGVRTALTRLYYPLTDTIVTLSSDNWPAVVANDRLPGGSAVYNNKLYVFGGFEVGVGMLSGIWQFDPALPAGSRWVTKTATLSTPLGYIPTATFGNYIYLLGGSGFDGSVPTDSTVTQRYDPNADTIDDAVVPDLARAVGETRAVPMPNNEIWVLGGGRDAPNPNTQVDIYHTDTMTWTVGIPLLTPRRNFAADSNPSANVVWTAGGYDDTGTAGSAVTENYGCTTIPTGVQMTTVQAATANTESDLTVVWLLAAALAALGTFALVRRQGRTA